MAPKNIMQSQNPADQDPPEKLPEIVPIVPVINVAMFPKMQLPIMVGQSELVQLVDDAMGNDRVIGILASKSNDVTGLHKPGDLYDVGTAAVILRMAKIQDGAAQMLAQGLSRFRVVEYIQERPYLKARVTPLLDQGKVDTEAKALMAHLLRLFSQMVETAPYLPQEIGEWAKTISEPGVLADVVASAMQTKPTERQKVLEIVDLKERLNEVIQLATNQLEILLLEKKIHTQVKGDMDKTQKDYYLRQQLKAIRDELGETDESTVVVDDYQARIEEKNLPELAKKEADRELDRLSRMHSSSSEYTVATTYLDWLTALPWNDSTADNLDIAKAEKILNDDHYGLEKPKKRILEYLAVRKLKPDSKGPILCLAGPPGTGKTSLGKSIARALGRKFVRISLGGVRDEAEIRGHRRTYVGALPGRIIQSLRRAGSNNPVFMLDEIDKVGSDFRGDPSSALLEVLDPEQNDTFSDHYLDVPFDLSKVMFITTANVLDTIPHALRDRMEVIRLSGYTLEEKIKISRRYLVPRQREANGLMASQIKITDGALKRIITGYTREAGLRNLEREIAGVCRGVARTVAEKGSKFKPVSIKGQDVKKFLGPVHIPPEVPAKTLQPGVVTGLAWTAHGGEILTIEATGMSGHKNMLLTGQLGDVMKESATAALSFIRANADKLGLSTDFFKDRDVHIHVPAGAIPKDGPSAGVTILSALFSLFSDRAVKKGLAMTGEITLSGQVLPVGGVKEKVLAAYRAKIKEVILPAWNKKDMEDIAANVKKSIVFHFVETMDQVLDVAFPGQKKNNKKGRKK